MNINRILTRLLALSLLLWSWGGRAMAEGAPKEQIRKKEVRNSVWSIGLNGTQHSLKSGDGHNLLGTSMVIQIGRGQIGERWYLNYSIDIISGPFRIAQKRDVSIDYSGTGLTTFIGYAAEEADIRTEKGNYGFALGVNYTDIIGRSIEETYSQDGNEAISSFVMRVTEFSLLPAIFFTWLEQGRPYDNRPEFLATRIEGYLLTIGIAVPLLANYRVNFLKYDLNQKTDDQKEEESDQIRPDSITEKGTLRGYTIVIAFSALLGV